ncbi:hypothetical protein H4217_003401 [Coemansia sp. RSA 1939]|nr:hypothetical protein H4217_003401 [Coemansia sp. RSA 1939]KAJ2612035.1 hypothetical protein EV177_003198 [Coemansia sp. RSA 1804]
MDTWVLALVCTAIAIGGALFGAVAMFAVIRYRRHQHMKYSKSCTVCAGKGCFGSCIRTADDIVGEELASELTPAEKQVLHKIAGCNGAISLTLRLPEPSLGIPLSPATVPNGSIKGTRFSISSTDALSLPLPPLQPMHGEPAGPQSASNCDNSTTMTGKRSSAKIDLPPNSCTSPTAAAAFADALESQSHSKRHSQRHSQLPRTSQSSADAQTAAPAQPDDSATSKVNRLSVKSFKTFQSKRTSVQRMASKMTCVDEVAGAVSWSSPVDDRSRKSAAFDTVTMAPDSNTSNDGVKATEKEKGGSMDADGSTDSEGDEEAAHSPTSGSTPSVAESNPETISTGTPPGSPRTLASPCNSFDYVFIPPSPSISSLYGATGMETLAHAPSTLANPRSASLAKSISSPVAAVHAHAHASLFSPPPVAYHQKYFETHSPRSPLVPSSSSDKSSS